MKKTFFPLLIAFMSIHLSSAQVSCSKFYPMGVGTKFQITVTGKNDKPTAVIDYVVKSSTGDGATLAYEMRDDKGKTIVTSAYGVICANDGISIDFKSLAAPGIFEQYKDMEVDITGTNLLLPNNLSTGQLLPDADMLMKVKMAPISMKLTAKVYDRKVEGKETITTPAGTFNCFVITYGHESKMGIKFSGTAKQWLAEGVGMVQQLDYNKKGKLVGRSVLTKFEK